MALLDHESPAVVRGAARNIMDAAITVAGKDEACAKGAIDKLILLLHTTPSEQSDVIAAVCSALMTITITTAGKKMALENGLVECLPHLLTHEDERVLLAGVKLITTMAEAPAARVALQTAVPRLTVLTKYVGERLDEVAVARSAQTAIDTITWTA
jgi:hypothetical protein